MKCSFAIASFLLPFLASAAHSGESASPSVYHLPIHRRSAPNDVASFQRKAANTRARYEVKDHAGQRKRSDKGENVYVVNSEGIAFYVPIGIGTPQASFNVILDTGSADLIIANSACVNCPPSTPLYAAPSSSSSEVTATPFSISYGSGSATGTLVKDTVVIAGSAISGQTFAACNNIENILAGSITGLLGLGWQPLAASGAVPLLQALYNGGSLAEGMFSFAFVTYPATSQIYQYSRGGQMTVGGTNSSLYTGPINWIPINQPAAYWKIPLQAITIGGVDLGLNSSGVVMDTGTTLIGGPAAAVAAIYAAIPGSAPTTVEGVDGYYSYPCALDVDIEFKFGNMFYRMPASAFNAGNVDRMNGTCLGSIFELQTHPSLSWIFGDSFLTGVYSSFRFSGVPSIGFAQLATGNSTVDGSSPNQQAIVSGGFPTATMSSLLLGAGLILSLWN